MKLVPIKTKKATTNNSRVNIAYHHFGDDMIVKHGAIVDSINFEESRKIGYVDNADRCSHNNERFWSCPNMSNEKIDDLLSKLGTAAAVKLSPTVLECVDSNDVALTTAQRLGKQRAEKLNRRHLFTSPTCHWPPSSV